MSEAESGDLAVTPTLVAAAKLRETINDRLGQPTSDAIRKIARAQPAPKIGPA